MTTALSVRNLKKIYGKKERFVAVDGISFDLKQNEILGLLGPNGSGKTTTIQMLLSTLAPTSGTIHYFGKDLTTHRSEVLQSISFASTYTSLPYSLTVRENLQCFGRFYGIKDMEPKGVPLLLRFGLLDKIDSMVSSLSAGQITRLMIVKAFFTEPKVVLLDEPTASLDPDIAHDVCRFLLEQREQRNISILFTSHKMAEVTELCDRAIFLKKGRIIADDLPKNLARSVSGFQLRLTILDGMKRTAALATEKELGFTVEHRTIEITLDEQQIPGFLHALMRADVSYTSIQIREPSLEDFFLQLLDRKT